MSKSTIPDIRRARRAARTLGLEFAASHFSGAAARGEAVFTFKFRADAEFKAQQLASGLRKLYEESNARVNVQKLADGSQFVRVTFVARKPPLKP